MNETVKTPRKSGGFLRRFLRDKNGATALEFGLVGAPFFVMMMGIAETTLAFFASVNLENGVEEVARLVRTGQVQTSQMTAAQFKNTLCDVVTPLVKCDGNLYVDVRTFEDFGNVEDLSPLDESGQINMAFQFDPGQPGSVVLARAFYVWDIATPGLSTLLHNMAGGQRLLAAAAVFRTEPYIDPNALGVN